MLTFERYRPPKSSDRKMPYSKLMGVETLPYLTLLRIPILLLKKCRISPRLLRNENF